MIPGNDDAISSIQLYLEGVADAVIDSHQVTGEPLEGDADEYVEIDLIEEIARLYGFENIPTSSPMVIVSPINQRQEQSGVRKVKDTLSHLGYSEIVNYSFIENPLAETFKAVYGSEKTSTINLSNPLSSDMETMRTSLLPGLIKTAVRNINKGQKPVKVFEVGHVFFQDSEDRDIREKRSLAGLVHGGYENDVWKPQGGEYGFFDLKGVLETVMSQFKLTLGYKKKSQTIFLFGKTLDCFLNEKHVGLLGEINLNELDLGYSSEKVYVFEIDFDCVLKELPDKVRFTPIPKFPETYRDISILVNKTVTSKAISDLIEKAGSPIISRVELYDYFEGKKLPKGKKSLTFALAFQSTGKTLTDEEVNPVFERIVKRLLEEQGAILREA